MPQILSTGAKCNAYAKEYVVFGARSPVADFLSPSHEWQADPNQYVLLGAGHSQTLLKVLKMQIRCPNFPNCKSILSGLQRLHAESQSWLQA